MEERLQKLMSSCGLCARRTAEAWIQAGRVTVNGIPAQLGDRADLEKDVVEVDGVPLHREEKRTYLMLYKPRGYVTTLSDEQGRKTVAQLVFGCGCRVWPVGRLDLDSEGLLLLTDDGDLTHKLIHPSHEIEKEYLVWVKGNVDKALPILNGPMELDGQPLATVQVTKGHVTDEVTQLVFVLRQGKNRQIRRMCEQVGLTVTRLKRIREGGICLDRSLKIGKWRYLTQQETAILLSESKA